MTTSMEPAVITTSTLRLATVEDVIRRMRSEHYQSYALGALGWGMGHAQLGITAAVNQARTLGLVTTEPYRHDAGKTMVALTADGHSYCIGNEWASVETVYNDVSARCACGATLTKCLNTRGGTYWAHGWTHEQRCPAYECACGRRHNAQS